jgi:hypothetical protein
VIRRGFGSAGVPPAVLELASRPKTAGETPALQKLSLHIESAVRPSCHINLEQTPERGRTRRMTGAH